MSGQALEGWDVRARPAALAMAALILLLAVALSAGGVWYNARFAPRTHAKRVAFPEPRLETAQRPPGEPIGAGPPRPREIDAAMRAVAAQGDAAWAGR